MSGLKPIFNYAGGKTKYIQYFAHYFQRSNFYVEPFFGGGAVFCYMKNYNLADRYVINDINRSIAQIYRDIKKNPWPVIEEEKAIEASYFRTEKKERRYFYHEHVDAFHRNPSSGRLLFLLNRSYGSMWSTNSLTGLYSPTYGDLPIRIDKPPIVSQHQICLWHEALRNTEIFSNDYRELHIPEFSTVFCDPPYRNADYCYIKTFDDSDQVKCFEWCSSISKISGVSVIQTNNSDGVFFERLAAVSDKIVTRHYDAHYSNNPKHTNKKEIVIVWNPRV